jgi:hypothetical protein
MRKHLLVFAVLCAAVAFAQDEAAEKHIKSVLETRTVTLHFADTSLENVISFLQDITGLNMVIDPNCDKEKTITARLRDVKLKNALDLMLHPNGFDYVIHKGTLFVSTKEIIARMKGRARTSGSPELKEGELLLHMKDGSRIKGRVKHEKWTIATVYGNLVIPSHEIGKITIAHEKEKAKEEGEEKKEGKEKDKPAKAPDEDEVVTVRFTLTGKVEIDKLEVDTGRGKLTVTRKDIQGIMFPRPYLEKSVEVKPTGEWLDTGIKLLEGQEVAMSTEGVIKISSTSFSPDGKAWVEKATDSPQFSEGCHLVGRVGEKGKELAVGKAHTTTAPEDGKLYLRIKLPETEEEATGTYKVKLRLYK